MRNGIPEKFIRGLYLKSLMISFGILVSLVGFVNILTLFTTVNTVSLEAAMIFRLFFGLLMPEIIKTVMPAATFFGTLYFCYRLLNDRELIALQSLGMSYDWLFQLIFKTLLPLVMLMLVATHFILPKVTYLYDSNIKAIQSKTIFSEKQEKSFSSIDGNKGVLYLGGIETDDTGSGYAPIFIYQETDNMSLFEIATRATVRLKSGYTEVNLKNGKQLFIPQTKNFTIAVIAYENKTQQFESGIITSLKNNLKYHTSSYLPMAHFSGVIEFQKRTVIALLIMLFPMLALCISLRNVNPRASLSIAPLILIYFVLRALFFNVGSYTENDLEEYTAINLFVILLLGIFLFVTRHWNLR